VVVVGTDGSAAAQAALETALSLAEDDEPFVLVTAWQELTGDFGLPYARLLAPDVAEIEREWAEKTVSEAAERVRAAGHPVATVIRHGRPAKAICAVAAEQDARLIVVGSTGWGPIEGLLVGSVSAGVLREAECAVVAVRPPRQGQEQE
jgi:nucleotide-binding universal stress UspA family protein